MHQIHAAGGAGGLNPATPLRYAPLVGQSTTGETDEYLFHDTHLDL